MGNKYLEKIAEKNNFSNYEADRKAWKATLYGTAGGILGTPIPGGGLVGNAALSRYALKHDIPESKKDNWVGTHSFGHALLGGTLGGIVGAGSGALGAPIISGGSPSARHAGAYIGGLPGALLGDKAGRKYHLQHSDDFRE